MFAVGRNRAELQVLHFIRVIKEKWSDKHGERERNQDDRACHRHLVLGQAAPGIAPKRSSRIRAVEPLHLAQRTHSNFSFGFIHARTRSTIRLKTTMRM